LFTFSEESFINDGDSVGEKYTRDNQTIERETHDGSRDQEKMTNKQTRTKLRIRDKRTNAIFIFQSS